MNRRAAIVAALVLAAGAAGCGRRGQPIRPKRKDEDDEGDARGAGRAPVFEFEKGDED